MHKQHISNKTLTALKIRSFHVLSFPVTDFTTGLFFKSDFFFNGENLDGLIQTCNQTFSWQTCEHRSSKPSTLCLLLKVHFTLHKWCVGALPLVPLICVGHCDMCVVLYVVSQQWHQPPKTSKECLQMPRLHQHKCCVVPIAAGTCSLPRGSLNSL